MLDDEMTMLDFEIPKGQPLARSHKKMELSRLLIARSDITAALRSCDLILENVKGIEDERLYPLTAAVVVCYSRPFTANKPYGYLPAKWTKFSDLRFKKAHEKLIEARHTLFAHSDMEARRPQIVPPNSSLEIEGVGDLKSPFVSTQVRYVLFQVEFFAIVKETILDLGRRMQVEIDGLIADLYSGLDLPNAPFHIRIDEGL
jgi:hypothetical protein